MTISEVIRPTDSIQTQMEVSASYLRGKYMSPAYVTPVNECRNPNGGTWFKAVVGVDFSFGETVESAVATLEIKLQPYYDNLRCRLCDEPVGNGGKLLSSPHGFGVDHQDCRQRADEIQLGDERNSNFRDAVVSGSRYDAEGL